MSGGAVPSDADLVARVLAADREAFAQIYDRYGDRLHDFAHSMLRHREDAADAVADSFVILAERLSQLRDPSRLRPWLYAVVRSECLRRIRARTRVSYGDDEQLAAMADDDALGPDEAAERAELRRLVWDAAAGLAERDRALMDLHLRQGLEGADLAEAMGVSTANVYVMLNRMRAQVDRSLGALLIARLGRDDCPDLAALLTDWDGTFSPLIRKRVARHVDDCALCERRRRTMLSPLALFAGVPLFAAPAGLRDRVLDEVRLVAAEPLVTRTPSGGRRAAGLAAGAALVVIAIVAVVLLWPSSERTTPVEDALPTLSPGLPTAVAPSLPADPTTATGSPSALPSGSPSAPATASTAVTGEPGPGALTVSSGSIDLGRSATRDTVRLSNSGGTPLTFRASEGAGWLSVAPGQSSLGPGESTALTLRADRARVPEGASSARVTLSWEGGSVPVTVRIRQERAPAVGRPAIADPSPSWEVTVTARVSDESGLSSVRLRWTGPTSGSAAMSRSGSGWSAVAGPIGLGGGYTFSVTATDARGNQATGPAYTRHVDPCAG